MSDVLRALINSEVYKHISRPKRQPFLSYKILIYKALSQHTQSKYCKDEMSHSLLIGPVFF